eukprot:scaffold1483_cov379-Prasinococcus_capsulatus_cf.AAC.17
MGRWMDGWIDSSINQSINQIDDDAAAAAAAAAAAGAGAGAGAGRGVRACACAASASRRCVRRPAGGAICRQLAGRARSAPEGRCEARRRGANGEPGGATPARSPSAQLEDLGGATGALAAGSRSLGACPGCEQLARGDRPAQLGRGRPKLVHGSEEWQAVAVSGDWSRWRKQLKHP